MRSLARDNRGLIEGVIWKQLLIYFFPILLGTFFQQLYNTVDAVVVGNVLGKQALAAVGGATGTIINLLVGFFVGLSSGATVVISQYYGMGDENEVGRAVHTSIALSLIGGVILMVVGLLGSRWALEAMGTTEDVIDGAAEYMRIYFAGVILNLLYNMGSGILRAIGDSRRPMVYLIVCCVVNIALDLLFVGAMGMGVGGAALATIISQGASAVLVMVALVRSKECYRFIPRKLRLDMELLRRVLKIGFPAGLQSMMYSISNLIIQANINALGTDTMAAWTAFGKVDSIIWMIMGAFGVAITTFVGQNWGARKPDRVRKSIRTCLALSIGSTVFMSGVILVAGHPLIRLFTSDEAVMAISMTIMHCNVPLYFTYVCIEILSGAMRGMGNSFGPMLIICVGICVLRIIWLFTAVPMSNNIITIVISYPISWIVTSIAMVVYYYRWSRRVGLRRWKVRGEEA
ncbi:MAG: MATE family efflux transporter [Candidatus Fimadaptatus sp.]|jgi:putative MATE family efflux protein